MSLEFKPLSDGLGLSHMPEVDPPRPPRAKVPPQTAPRATPMVRPAPVISPMPVTEAMPAKDWVLLGRRVAAFFIDTLFNTSLLALAFAGLMFRFGPRAWDLLSFELGVLLVSLFAFSSWAIVLAQELAFRSSLGKWAMGIHLPGGRVAIFIRAFFFPLSLVALGLGLLWSLWDRRGRCWHDMLADLQPLFKK